MPLASGCLNARHAFLRRRSGEQRINGVAASAQRADAGGTKEQPVTKVGKIRRGTKVGRARRVEAISSVECACEENEALTTREAVPREFDRYRRACCREGVGIALERCAYEKNAAFTIEEGISPVGARE